MIWLRSPDFADVFVRGQAAECLETACIIVGIKKVAEMVAKLIVTIVVTPFHGCVLNRASSVRLARWSMDGLAGLGDARSRLPRRSYQTAWGE